RDPVASTHLSVQVRGDIQLRTGSSTTLVPPFATFRRPPVATLFPYTTLFRSGRRGPAVHDRRREPVLLSSPGPDGATGEPDLDRSEERRVGKECRSRRSAQN